MGSNLARSEVEIERVKVESGSVAVAEREEIFSVHWPRSVSRSWVGISRKERLRSSCLRNSCLRLRAASWADRREAASSIRVKRCLAMASSKRGLDCLDQAIRVGLETWRRRPMAAKLRP